MTALLVPGVTALLSLLMMAAWVVQRRAGNAGWVDVVWTFALGLGGITYALVPAPGIAWPGARQVLVAVAAALWSIRLGLHLWNRTRHGPEDSRYARFRHDWGGAFQRRMFGFLQVQAAAAAVLAAAFLLAARNPRPLGWQDGLAVLVLVMAVAGEAIADAQLHRFRDAHAQDGSICDSGLWGLSRHPNYFFEWFGWLAYPLFAIDLSGHYPAGWLALAAPALMYWLLVHVSGIPPLEQQMLRTRGSAYRAYRRRTRAFLPFPRMRTP